MTDDVSEKRNLRWHQALSSLLWKLKYITQTPRVRNVQSWCLRRSCVLHHSANKERPDTSVIGRVKESRACWRFLSTLTKSVLLMTVTWLCLHVRCLKDKALKKIKNLVKYICLASDKTACSPPKHPDLQHCHNCDICIIFSLFHIFYKTSTVKHWDAVVQLQSDTRLMKCFGVLTLAHGGSYAHIQQNGEQRESDWSIHNSAALCMSLLTSLCWEQKLRFVVWLNKRQLSCLGDWDKYTTWAPLYHDDAVK